MRDRLDQIWSQLSYYVDEVLIRVGLARDDPAVDLRSRGIVAIAICVITVTLGSWWYVAHVLTAPLPNSTATKSETNTPLTISAPPYEQAVSPPSTVSAPTSDVEVPSVATDTNCSPNYSPCVPDVAGDLNCDDIGHQTVKVIGIDRYELDRDQDGYGCE